MTFGGGELFVILVVVLLLFGPSQLPKVARGFGQAIREFKKAQREITDEIERDPAETSERRSAPPAPPENKPVN